MHQMHIINNMKSNTINNRSSSNKNRMILFPSLLDKQERTTSTESTISTSGHIKDMLLSPIASCKSPSSIMEMNTVAPSYCCTPSHSARSNQQSRVVESSYQQQHPNGRKKAVYRNRTSPPLYSKKSMPKTRSNPSLSSGQDSYGVVEECTRHTSSAAAAALLNGENLLDKAALDPCNSWNDDAESSYTYSSQDQLLTNNNNNKTIISQHHPPSCSSYDCNYKYTQETAYEDFGVERKLIDKSYNMRQSSSTSSTTHHQSSGIIGGKKKKHWIRLRQSISTQSQALTLPSRKPSSFTGLKKATSLGSASSTLPPSGKSFTPKKSPPPAVRTGSAPPTYFHVDIKDGQYSSSSVGYHSAPIETELRPDQSLSQMGMEVTEEDYCIEGEYMARQFQQLQEQQQEEEHTASGCSSNQRKGSNKKFSESVFSMKELAKGLEGLSTRKKPCSPKVIKTKVLSALRRGSGSDNNATTDASDKKKKIPHQIAITVTPSTSEDTGDDHLSLEDMQLLYKWQHARCRNDFNQFLSRRRVVSCNTDDDCTRVEMAITKKTSEDVMSITSSVGDRTVSVDNRRCSIQRQVSF
mmetsp:Transcript_17769/g.26507  ORF Transcript_17769/g.26507 Transcript_17769/m.26507 type:complete len:581 (-) Transcript_17769:80-1822(-)